MTYQDSGAVELVPAGLRGRYRAAAGVRTQPLSHLQVGDSKRVQRRAVAERLLVLSAYPSAACPTARQPSIAGRESATPSLGLRRLTAPAAHAFASLLAFLIHNIDLHAQREYYKNAALTIRGSRGGRTAGDPDQRRGLTTETFERGSNG